MILATRLCSIILIVIEAYCLNAYDSLEFA